MSELSENILGLRAEGMTYNQIQQKLNCSKGTIAYYLGDGQKEKYLDRQRTRRGTIEGGLKHKTDVYLTESKKSVKVRSESNKSPARKLSDKAGDFQTPFQSKTRGPKVFTYQDVLVKFSDQPTCYLTGDVLDLAKPSTYEFDHIVPRSKGGDNSLDNLGLTTKEANRAKGSLSVEEFVELCTKIAKNFGTI